MSPLAFFLARCGERPIYVASRVCDRQHFQGVTGLYLHLRQELEDAAVEIGRTIDIQPGGDLLRNGSKTAAYVLGAFHYHDADDWRERWPAERARYGGIIVATFDHKPFDDWCETTRQWEASKPFVEKGKRRGNPALREWRRAEPEMPGWRGIGHLIGPGIARELLDMRDLDRPILWIATEGPRVAIIKTFSADPVEPGSSTRFARLLEAAPAVVDTSRGPLRLRGGLADFEPELDGLIQAFAERDRTAGSGTNG